MNAKILGNENSLEIDRKILFWSILAFGFLVRIVAMVLYADINPITANLWEYGEIARESIAFGDLVRVNHLPDGSLVGPYPTAFMPPLPIFIWISIFSSLGDNQYGLAAFLVMNLTLSMAIVYFIHTITFKLSNSHGAALCAMAIATIYPTFAVSPTTYHAIQIYLFLFLCGVNVVLSSYRISNKKIVLLGVIGGLAALTRTEYILLFGAIYTGSFLIYGRYKNFLLATLISALVVLPWTVRNYIVFEEFIPVANITGFGFIKGFNEHANGSGDWVDNNNIIQDIAGEYSYSISGDRMFEFTYDQFLLKEAKKFVAANPVDAFLYLPIKKMALFWGFDVYDPMSYNIFYQIALWTTFVLSMGALLYGRNRVASQLRGRDIYAYRIRVVVGIFIAQSFVICIYAVHLRYRMNVDPFLFSLAGVGLVIFVRKYLPGVRLSTDD